MPLNVLHQILPSLSSANPQITLLDSPSSVEKRLKVSCSLLHVPYTVKNEPQLSTEIIRHFSFAYEKLDELRELCCLAELADYSCDRRYLQNQELFQTSELRTDTEVQKQVAALTESDFTRRVPRKERQATQKELLNLPLLPTTTIGSFPQTKEVKQNRTKFRKGEISEETALLSAINPEQLKRKLSR